jgi:hypothetical protein
MPIAFSFLSNLCVHKVASEATITSGVVPAVLAVLKKYNSDDRIQIRGLRSLENIAYGSTGVKDNMRREGVETAVVAIADANPTKDDLRRLLFSLHFICHPLPSFSFLINRYQLTHWVVVAVCIISNRACKAVLDALNRGRKDLGSMPVATIKPVQIQKKSAKSLFGDEYVMRAPSSSLFLLPSH